MSTAAATAEQARRGQQRTEQIARIYARMTAAGWSYADKIDELGDQFGITRRAIERHLARARDQGLLPATARSRPMWRPRQP